MTVISTKSTKEKLREILMSLAFNSGSFSLSSGEQSSYYFDGKRVTLNAEGSFLVAKEILDRIKGDILNGNIKAIGGLTLGADPIIASTITLSWIEHCPINGFIVRKEAKKHGKQLFIEGIVNRDDRVIIIDDVTTKGTSVLKAIKKTEEAGAKVIKIISIVDRLEGAKECFEKENIEFEPIFTKDELFEKEYV